MRGRADTVYTASGAGTANLERKACGEGQFKGGQGGLQHTESTVGGSERMASISLLYCSILCTASYTNIWIIVRTATDRPTDRPRLASP